MIFFYFQRVFGPIEFLSIGIDYTNIKMVTVNVKTCNYLIQSFSVAIAQDILIWLCFFCLYLISFYHCDPFNAHKLSAAHQ